MTRPPAWTPGPYGARLRRPSARSRDALRPTPHRAARGRHDRGNFSFTVILRAYGAVAELADLGLRVSGFAGSVFDRIGWRRRVTARWTGTSRFFCRRICASG